MIHTFYKRLLITAGVFGVIGVVFGAFGAHFLKERLDSSHIETLKTGVLYLFIHTIAMLSIIILCRANDSSRLLKSSGLLFAVGVILFSGSLFIISTGPLTGFPVRFIGPLTPAGGLCFIAGWILLIYYGASGKS